MNHFWDLIPESLAMNGSFRPVTNGSPTPNSLGEIIS
jgi:hypothetical protein